MHLEITNPYSNMFRTIISHTRIPLTTITQILFVRTISVPQHKETTNVKILTDTSLTLQLFLTCRKQFLCYIDMGRCPLNASEKPAYAREEFVARRFGRIGRRSQDRDKNELSSNYVATIRLTRRWPDVYIRGLGNFVIKEDIMRVKQYIKQLTIIVDVAASFSPLRPPIEDDRFHIVILSAHF